MLNGHGDDLHLYTDIEINFSSNVFNHFDHSGLFAYLADRLPHISSYPEPEPVTLESEIAAHLDIAPSQVIATNGATEAIYLIAHAFSGSSSSIITPTFSEYADACRINGHRLDSDTDDIIWLCNPNNPTGLTLGKDAMTELITESPDILFVIDASYAPFTLEPLITASEGVRLHNVLMLHSMTKEFAIPGLRLGYITGNASLLARIHRYRMPWSVNQLAQDAGCYLIRHAEDYRLNITEMMAERRRVADILSHIDGIQVHPSDTHILLCQTPSSSDKTQTAAALKKHLAANHNILIRDAANFEGLNPSYFRIAIQTPCENDTLINAIRQWTKLLQS